MINLLNALRRSSINIRISAAYFLMTMMHWSVVQATCNMQYMIYIYISAMLLSFEKCSAESYTTQSTINEFAIWHTHRSPPAIQKKRCEMWRSFRTSHRLVNVIGTYSMPLYMCIYRYTFPMILLISNSSKRMGAAVWDPRYKAHRHSLH